MMIETRISKRKYQQVGTPANRKLDHIIRHKTLARRAAVAEAFYIDHARAAEIGISPIYRNAQGTGQMPTVESWNATAKQWDADHDVTRKPKATNKKSRTRRSKARHAGTYRAARRNADTSARPKLIAPQPTHSWPVLPKRRGPYWQNDMSEMRHADLLAIQQAEAKRALRNAKRAAA